ncbi:hypothetical protein CDAR_409721 [Caerostris darwini]|uniref:BHLH domain-containing protein n=1 Tax=Caerostris darwini TaxID=1538125 RepID=A0AAV4VJX0_9ARAC|nr:hypothetical protein CDAR_409721 [Caerostris darwini]
MLSADDPTPVMPPFKTSPANGVQCSPALSMSRVCGRCYRGTETENMIRNRLAVVGVRSKNDAPQEINGREQIMLIDLSTSQIEHMKAMEHRRGVRNRALELKRGIMSNLQEE